MTGHPAHKSHKWGCQRAVVPVGLLGCPETPEAQPAAHHDRGQYVGWDWPPPGRAGWPCPRSRECRRRSPRRAPIHAGRLEYGAALRGELRDVHTAAGLGRRGR